MRNRWNDCVRIAALLAAALSIAACNLGGGSSDSGSSGPDNPPGPTACTDGPLPGDKDCDGLTDTQENQGWQVTVDYTGRGETTTYTVTSNPNAADTDGDGLDDHAEFINHYDPRKADSDEDGLNDYDEKYVYATQPLNGDSDGDNVNTDQFKDGDEVARGTSPLEKDTDGDGMDDPLEALTLGTNPQVADRPKIDFKFTKAPTITLNCSESNGTTTTKGFSADQSSSQSSSVSTESGFSLGLEHSMSATVGTTIEANAGLFDYGSVDVSMEMSQSLTQSFGTSFSLTNDQVKETSKSFSQYQEESASANRTCDNADMTTWAQLTNTGDMSFKMDNISVAVYTFNRVDPSQRGTPITTLYPVQSDLAVTLAPGASATVELTTGDNKLNLDVAKELLVRRVYMEAYEAGTANLWISPKGSEVNYAYQADDVKAKTATVVVDAGGKSDTYQVAVKQRFDPDTGKTVGLSVADVADAIGLQYSTEAVDLDVNGTTVHTERISSLNGVANDDANNVRWLVAGDFSTLADSGYDITQVHLHPGQLMYFLYTRDADGDGIGMQEEAQYGTSDEKADSDGDGLLDYDEIHAGWTVNTASPYTVYPDPANGGDYDGDGWNDAAEKNAGTNPYDSDTDGDHIADNIDPDPLTFTSGPSISDLVGAPVTNATATNLQLTWTNGTSPVPDGILILKSTSPWNGTPTSGNTYASGDTVTDDNGVAATVMVSALNGDNVFTNQSFTDTADFTGQNVHVYAWPYQNGSGSKPVYLKEFEAKMSLDLENLTISDLGSSIKLGWDKPGFNFGGVLVLKALADADNGIDPSTVSRPTDGEDYSALPGTTNNAFYTIDSNGNKHTYSGVQVVYTGSDAAFTDTDVGAGEFGQDRDYYYFIYGFDSDHRYLTGHRVLRRDQLYQLDPSITAPVKTRTRFQTGDEINVWTAGQWNLDKYTNLALLASNAAAKGSFYADGSSDAQYWDTNTQQYLPITNPLIDCNGGGRAYGEAPVFRTDTGASTSDYHPISRDINAGYDSKWWTGDFSGASGGVELYVCTQGSGAPDGDAGLDWFTSAEDVNSYYKVRMRVHRWTTLP